MLAKVKARWEEGNFSTLQSRIVSKKMEKGPGKYKEVARRLKRALVEKDMEEEKKKEAAKMKRVREEVEKEMEKED